METCVENCREDVIKRIGLRMTTKNFLISLAIVVAALGTAGTIAYTAYAGSQKEVRKAVGMQTELARKTEKKVTEIEVNQQHVLRRQTEFKDQINGVEQNQRLILQEILKIRAYQINEE